MDPTNSDSSRSSTSPLPLTLQERFAKFVECNGEQRKENWKQIFEKYTEMQVDDNKSMLISEFIMKHDEEYIVKQKSAPLRIPRNVNTVHSRKIPPMGCENYEKCLREVVEHDLMSNLREVTHKRSIAQIFGDDDMYENAHVQAKREMARVAPEIGKDNIRAYLKIINRVEHNNGVSTLIETIFRSNLKALLLKREKAESEEEFKHYCGKIQTEWKELSALMDDSDILMYAVYHIRSM